MNASLKVRMLCHFSVLQWEKVCLLLSSTLFSFNKTCRRFACHVVCFVFSDFSLPIKMQNSHVFSVYFISFVFCFIFVTKKSFTFG